MAKKAASKVPVAKKAATTPAVNPFEAMRRSMDEMMGRMLREWPAGDVFAPLLGDRGVAITMPSIDVSETDKAYEVAVDLPGMDEKDVDVSLDNDVLTVKAEHSEKREEKKKTYHVTERRHGSFQRSLRLPADVDAQAITAAFAKGVLTVTLPKGKKATSAKKIAIKSA